MNILGLTILSLGVSQYIDVKNVVHGISQIGDKGYKFIDKSLSYENKEKNLDFNDKMKLFIEECIPFYNVYVASKMNLDDFTSKLIESGKIQQMSDEEKLYYNTLNTKFDKLLFQTLIASKCLNETKFQISLFNTVFNQAKNDTENKMFNYYLSCIDEYEKAKYVVNNYVGYARYYVDKAKNEVKENVNDIILKMK